MHSCIFSGSSKSHVQIPSTDKYNNNKKKQQLNTHNSSKPLPLCSLFCLKCRPTGSELQIITPQGFDSYHHSCVDGEFQTRPIALNRGLSRIEAPISKQYASELSLLSSSQAFLRSVPRRSADSEFGYAKITFNQIYKIKPKLWRVCRPVCVCLCKNIFLPDSIP